MAGARVICLVKGMKRVLLLYMRGKTRDDLHAASRSKMRGARPRRARNGWAGIPKDARVL